MKRMKKTKRQGNKEKTIFVLQQCTVQNCKSTVKKKSID